MIRWMRVGVVVAVGAMATAVALMEACAETPAASPTAAMQAVAATSHAPAFAAMNYYDESCARCHGPQGAFYGPSLGGDLDDKGLVKEVRDMADGPAQATLKPEEVEIETAFHRALIVGTPYLAVTDITGDKWTGEVMPDAKVTVAVGDKKIAAKVDESNWTAELPAGTKIEDVVITAELEGKKTVLKPAESMYSHREHILPPDERKKK